MSVFIVWRTDCPSARIELAGIIDHSQSLHTISMLPENEVNIHGLLSHMAMQVWCKFVV